MPRVTLPENCYGFDMGGSGKKISGKPGSHVEVSSSEARQIKNSFAGQSGIVHGEQYSFGTKKGRRCGPCKRLWNAWNHECPRCGGDTTIEE